jgi:hypothetical protein
MMHRGARDRGLERKFDLELFGRTARGALQTAPGRVPGRMITSASAYARASVAEQLTR